MSLKLVPFKSLGAVSCFLMIRSNYGAIWYHLRDTATCWSKFLYLLYWTCI